MATTKKKNEVKNQAAHEKALRETTKAREIAQKDLDKATTAQAKAIKAARKDNVPFAVIGKITKTTRQALYKLVQSRASARKK